MRWIRFTAEGRTSYGSLAGEAVTEVSGEPWGEPEPDRQDAQARRRDAGSAGDPRTFYAAGINYAAHIRENGR